MVIFTKKAIRLTEFNFAGIAHAVWSENGSPYRE